MAVDALPTFTSFAAERFAPESGGFLPAFPIGASPPTWWSTQVSEEWRFAGEQVNSTDSSEYTIVKG